jgi:DNA-binding PadR family transcriptional regulator
MRQLNRVRLQKGRHLVRRGEIWYLETCDHGFQERRTLGTGDLPTATRLAMQVPPPAPRAAANPKSSTLQGRLDPRSETDYIPETDIAEEGSADPALSAVGLWPEVSELLIAVAIGRGLLHGYAIMKEVHYLSNGLLRVGPGTLYRTLQRMRSGRRIEEVKSTQGKSGDQRRRVFRLTQKGLLAARRGLSLWESLVRAARARGIIAERPG